MSLPSYGTGNLPDYENPPVIEVVCGVLFKPVTAFLTPYVGLLWEKYRSEYPKCSEVAPLDPIIERFDEPQPATLEIVSVPPLPRVWFVQEKGNGVIQIQRDRFLYNWRKRSQKDSYPRYHSVKEDFQNNIAKFQDLLEENSLGSIEPLQYEMTYINHIPQGEGWETLADIGQVFPDFTFRVSESRFLPEPTILNWRTSFIIPESSTRMHVVIRNVKLRDSGRPIILLELTVRGIGAEKSTEKMWEWFDIAREWIVRGFADITGEKLQREIWKATK